MGQLNPWGVVLVGILLAGLLVGGDQIQITMRLPAAVALVLQGAILFFMLGGVLFNQYRLRVDWGLRRRSIRPTLPAEGGES
jgi:simple sugar transport system permease protein